MKTATPTDKRHRDHKSESSEETSVPKIKGKAPY